MPCSGNEFRVGGNPSPKCRHEKGTVKRAWQEKLHGCYAAGLKKKFQQQPFEFLLGFEKKKIMLNWVLIQLLKTKISKRHLL